MKRTFFFKSLLLAAGLFVGTSAAWADPNNPTSSFAKGSITLYPEGTVTQTVNTDSDGGITYSSSNTNVATVNGSTGAVTAVAAGVTTITATTAATDNYNAGTTSYTVVVVGPVSNATTIYQRGITTAWSNSDITTTEGTNNVWYHPNGKASADYFTGLYVDNYGLHVGARDTYNNPATLALNHSEGSLITLDAVWYDGYKSSDANTPYSTFTYGSFTIKKVLDSRSLSLSYTINGQTTIIGNYDNGKYYNIHLGVNTNTGVITEFYIMNGETVLAKYADLTNSNNSFAADADYNTVSMISTMKGSKANSWCALTSISIQETPRYTYTVKAFDSSNNELQVVNTGYTFKGNAATISYPSHINVNGTIYTTTALSDGGKQFAVTFTPDADDYVKKLTYTPSATTGVIFFTEGEDIPGCTVGTTGGNSTRCSNGATGYCSNLRLITLPAGTYAATIYNYGTKSNATTLKDGNTDGANTLFTFTPTQTSRESTTKEFTLTETKTLYITAGHRSSGVADAGIDFLYITGTPTNEIVGSVDYTTGYMASYKNLTIAKGESKKVTFNNYGGSANYNNWLLGLTLDSKDFAVRADNYVNGPDWAGWDFFNWSMKIDGVDIAEDDWATFLTYMQNSQVVMNISYLYDQTLSGYKFNLDATFTGGTHTYTYSVYYRTGLDLTDISLKLGVDHSWLEVLSVESTAVGVSLGTNGYATFASAYPLDLANLPSGLTAYKAAVSGTTVTFTEVTEAVQANTGLLLGGDASETYSIPVAASGSDISSTNAFLVNTAGTTFPAEEGYTYYGLIKNSNPLTFGTFAPGTVAIPADKAYLMVANAQAARLVAVFGDESTGINAVNGEGFTGNGSVYNLSGQRVALPSKGLYMLNGKKVILK